MNALNLWRGAGFLLLMSPALAWANGEEIQFTGTVLAGSCQVTVPDIELGSVLVSSFSGKGSDSSTVVAWQITLSGCQGIIETVNVSLSGAADAASLDYFAVTEPTNTHASGVALKIMTDEPAAKVQKPDKSVIQWPWATIKTGSDSAVMRYTARYVQTEDTITTGEADGVINYTIDYL